MPDGESQEKFGFSKSKQKAGSSQAEVQAIQFLVDKNLDSKENIQVIKKTAKHKSPKESVETRQGKVALALWNLHTNKVFKDPSEEKSKRQANLEKLFRSYLVDAIDPIKTSMAISTISKSKTQHKVPVVLFESLKNHPDPLSLANLYLLLSGFQSKELIGKTDLSEYLLHPNIINQTYLETYVVALENLSVREESVTAENILCILSSTTPLAASQALLKMDEYSVESDVTSVSSNSGSEVESITANEDLIEYILALQNVYYDENYTVMYQFCDHLYEHENPSAFAKAMLHLKMHLNMVQLNNVITEPVCDAVALHQDPMKMAFIAYRILYMNAYDPEMQSFLAENSINSYSFLWGQSANSLWKELPAEMEVNELDTYIKNKIQRYYMDSRTALNEPSKSVHTSKKQSLNTLSIRKNMMGEYENHTETSAAELFPLKDEEELGALRDDFFTINESEYLDLLDEEQALSKKLKNKEITETEYEHSMNALKAAVTKFTKFREKIDKPNYTAILKEINPERQKNVAVGLWNLENHAFYIYKKVDPEGNSIDDLREYYGNLIALSEKPMQFSEALLFLAKSEQEPELDEFYLEVISEHDNPIAVAVLYNQLCAIKEQLEKPYEQDEKEYLIDASEIGRVIEYIMEVMSEDEPEKMIDPTTIMEIIQMLAIANPLLITRRTLKSILEPKASKQEDDINDPKEIAAQIAAAYWQDTTDEGEDVNVPKEIEPEIVATNRQDTRNEAEDVNDPKEIEARNMEDEKTERILKHYLEGEQRRITFFLNDYFDKDKNSPLHQKLLKKIIAFFDPEHHKKMHPVSLVGSIMKFLSHEIYKTPNLEDRTKLAMHLDAILLSVEFQQAKYPEKILSFIAGLIHEGMHSAADVKGSLMILKRLKNRFVSSAAVRVLPILANSKFSSTDPVEVFNIAKGLGLILTNPCFDSNATRITFIEQITHYEDLETIVDATKFLHDKGVIIDGHHLQFFSQSFDQALMNALFDYLHNAIEKANDSRELKALLSGARFTDLWADIVREENTHPNQRDTNIRKSVKTALDKPYTSQRSHNRAQMPRADVSNEKDNPSEIEQGEKSAAVLRRKSTGNF